MVASPLITRATVAFDTQRRYRIVSDGAGAVYFYVNSTLVATHTTNLPSGFTITQGGIRLLKEVGTAARNASADFLAVRLPQTR